MLEVEAPAAAALLEDPRLSCPEAPAAELLALRLARTADILAFLFANERCFLFFSHHETEAELVERGLCCCCCFFFFFFKVNFELMLFLLICLMATNALCKCKSGGKKGNRKSQRRKIKGIRFDDTIKTSSTCSCYYM